MLGERADHEALEIKAAALVAGGVSVAVSAIVVLHEAGDFKLPFTIVVNSSLRRVRVSDRQKAAMNVEPTGTNPTVTGAIRQAARMTGADFKYLLATAQVESNLNPKPRRRRRRPGACSSSPSRPG
jgi:hypothetical protein